MTALATVAAQPFPAGCGDADDAEEHVIASLAGHMTYKRLIQSDAERLKAEKGLFVQSLNFSGICLLNCCSLT